MSHKYDTVSRAAAEHNAPEATIVPPLRRRLLDRSLSAFGPLSLALALCSGLVSATLIAAALLALLGSLLNGSSASMAWELAAPGLLALGLGWAMLLVSMFVLVIQAGRVESSDV